jgi:hypothetical protein
MNLSIIGATLLVLAGANSASAQTKPAATKAKPATTAVAASDAPAMKAGLWEIAIVERVPGSTNTRTITARACYSADDVKVIERVLPQQRDFGIKCQHREIKAQGASVSWRLTCTGKESTSSGAATMSLGTDSFTAEVKLDVKAKGKPGKVEQAISGKWVGECA